MVDYYSPGTKVSVDANELQHLIRDKRSLEVLNKHLYKKVELLEVVVENYKNNPILHIDLKG